METAPLKSFATWARRELITQVSARLTAVLAPASPERVENQRAVAVLEHDIAAAGGGTTGREAIVDRVAYTWFNRIIAFRFMDANGYTGTGVVSPAHGQQTGQPEILADAKRGNIDPAVVGNRRTLDTIIGLLDGTRPSTDAQGEAYTLLLAEYCRYWNRSMPFMFEREGDYTELLIPSNLLAADSILARAATALTEEVCRDVEVIGWLYQFYISERKDEVFAGFKKGKKAGAAEIPAATQLFTPHWIVRYLVENSVGRLWMLNHPESHLIDQMDYYIESVDEQTDFLRISNPEDLTVIDPACGSGHMLTYAFDLLYAIYEEEGYAPYEIPELILTHNLYGTEIDPRAGALAAFALTMKARAKQHTLFGRQVNSNICVLEPIHFTPTEIDLLSSTFGESAAEAGLWNSCEMADTFGSLIRHFSDLTGDLRHRVARFDRHGDLVLADMLNRAERVTEYAEYLSSRYSVVITNPPYMGYGNMCSKLAEFATTTYPGAKGDLMTMFMERALDLLLPEGYVGMINLPSWMFLSSYEDLRSSILRSCSIQSLLHLGRGVFGADFGSVAFVIRRGHPDQTTRAVYRRLFTSLSEVRESEEIECLFLQPDFQWFEVAQSSFSEVPRHALAYWLPDGMRDTFVRFPPLSQTIPPKQGIKTGNNSRFLRFWWEVSESDTARGMTSRPAAKESGKKWFPAQKGGAFRRWYGNDEYVINWSRDGEEIRNYRDPISGKLLSRPQNIDRLFRGGLTWGTLSIGACSFRFSPTGFISESKGAIAQNDNLRIVHAALGFLNSSVSAALLAAISPTVDFGEGAIGKLPLSPDLLHTRVPDLVAQAIEISSQDWNRCETSPNFVSNELASLADAAVALRALLLHHRQTVGIEVGRLRDIEEEINLLVATTYGAESVVPLDVPEASVSLVGNPAYRYGPETSVSRTHARVLEDATADLVSYAVGCMFGRYGLDEPGLILAHKGATVQDYVAKVPTPTFAPDADNILPIVDGDWFDDDIVARFRQFLRVTFGDEHFEANLRFVEESLGVKSLREYFVTRSGRSRFYDDHVKRYKKRPIYWLFSSPKGSFNALIYMHRYTSSTVSTVLNEYLREYIAKLEASFQHQERLAAGEGTPRQKAAASKETERLRKILLELREYEHDVLYPLASKQVAIDLDDGVKANYPKFYPALRKIKGLEAADD